MTYIIAEAGTGHFADDGLESERLAVSFIGAAKNAGANAVKFQMFRPHEPLFCPMPGDDKRFERWDKTYIQLSRWKLLKQMADEMKIDLLWSAFQPTCIEWLKELKPRYVKVASRAARTFPYWWDGNDGQFIVSGDFDVSNESNYHLQCVPQYPTPLEKCGFDHELYDGLSDHSGTIWPGLDAIFHGAKFLEVHFKIPGADMGNDEPVCLTVDQLKLLCDARDANAQMHPA